MSQNFYAYNASRQAFISLGVKVADTPWSRLRGLLGKLKLRSDEGLWVVPSRGIHTIGLLFPIDVIYLNVESRVIYLMENLNPLRIAPLRLKCASVLEVPARTIEASGTEVGDLILIRSPQEICKFCAADEPGKFGWTEHKSVREA
jgi:uncharacterized protein